MSDTEIDIAIEEWVAHHRQTRERGFECFDFLAATATLDRASIAVTTHVMTADASKRALSRTIVPVGAELQSLSDIYAGAAWHEREAAELVGLRFHDRSGMNRLLTVEGAEPRHPLAWHAPLEQRLDQAWPGAYEPGGGSARRKREKQVPGLRPQWARRND